MGTFFLFFIFNPGGPSTNDKNPFATPTGAFFLNSPTPSPNFEAQNPVTKEDLIDLMPLSTDGFDIEYLVTTDAFVVTVKQSPFGKYQLEAEQWFQNQGVENLYNYNILWNKYPEVE